MNLDQLRRRHERLKRSLLALGPVLQGTILPRVIQRADPENPEHVKDYGPYYQWTRKIAGRTTIQNLTPVQAKAYLRAIQEHRKMERILAELRDISLKILELTNTGVKKRAPRKDRHVPLS
jgi:hypothetical protein